VWLEVLPRPLAPITGGSLEDSRAAVELATAGLAVGRGAEYLGGTLPRTQSPPSTHASKCVCMFVAACSSVVLVGSQCVSGGSGGGQV